MTKVIILLVLFFAFPPHSLAHDEVSSDFYFIFSKADYQSLLTQRQSGDIMEVVEDVRIEEPYATNLSGVSIAADYDYQIEVMENAHFTYKFQAEVTQVQMLVNQIVTDDVIRPNLPGVDLTIGIKADCQGIRVQHTGDGAQLNGFLSLVDSHNNLRVEVDQLEMVAPGGWDIHIDKCNGPSGYSDVVKQAILDFLADDQFINSFLQNALQSQFDNLVYEFTQELLQEMKLNPVAHNQINITPDKVVLDEQTGQVVLNGKVTSTFAQSPDRQQHVPFQIDSLSDRPTGLIISTQFIQTLSNQLYRNQFYGYGFRSSEIDGINRLTSSRLYQFFLFPDLMKFPRRSPFYFYAQPRQEPQLHISGQDKQFMWWQVQAQMQVLMYAPHNNQYVPYVNFYSPVSTSMWSTVHAGKLYIGVTRPQMNLSYAWDPQFQAIRRVNPRISINYFERQIQSSIAEQRHNFELPKIELSAQGHQLVPTEMDYGEQWVQLIYKPQLPAVTQD
jgi:hypothetical protein